MMHQLLRIVSVLLLIYFIPTGWLQASNSLVVNIPKYIFSADNKNWSISQDEKGYIYVANNDALLEFDGFSWSSFKLPNSTVVRSVLVSNHDKIYTGSFEDFGVWTRNCSGALTYQSLLTDELRMLNQNDEYWRIYENKGLIYFQSFSAIFIYDGVEVTRLKSNNGFLFLNKVRDNLYVQTINGSLNKIVKDSLIQLPNTESLGKSDVRIILPYLTDDLLIGTSNQGFYSYEKGELRKLDKDFDVIAKHNPNVGILGKNGNYFIGTLANGLYELSPSGQILECINAETNLHTNTILSVFQDHIGDVWLGLDGGIALVKDIPNLDVYVNNYNKTGGVYDAVEWSGHLLLATNQRVYALPIHDLSDTAKNKEWRGLVGVEGQVWKFKKVDNKLLVLHNNGVSEIKEDLSIHKFSSIDIGVFDLQQFSLQGVEKLLYASYFRVMISNLDGSNLTILEELKQPIAKVDVDHLSNIWMEHPFKGVYRGRLNARLDKFDTIEYYGGDGSLPYQLKFFKVGGRVELYGHAKFYLLNEQTNEVYENKLLNDALGLLHAKKVIEIGQNYFFALSEKSMTKFYYDGYKVEVVSNLPLKPFLTLIKGYEHVSILNDSIQIVCLDNGFGIYNSSLINDNQLAPQVPQPTIEAVLLRNFDQNIEEYICSNSHDINYSFNSLKWKVSVKNRFNRSYKLRYRLVGLSEDWLVAESNEVRFDRLPVGHYVLELQTQNTLGALSLVTSYSFKINPPWYLSPYSILFYLFFIIIVIYSIWVMVLRRYRNIHLHKIRQREVKRLRYQAANLQSEVDSKNAELLTMTSFIVYKNELIGKVKSLVHKYYEQNKLKSLLPLMQQIDALISQSVNPEDDWKLFLIKFEEKNTNFFTRLKELFPDLTSTDLRLCACLKLNMDTKEISSLMNATTRSIENRRYRLRKKMGLTSNQNLNEFLIQIN